MARLDAKWDNFTKRNNAWDHWWHDDGPDGGGGGPTNVLISQFRQVFRGVSARVFGRVN